MEHSKPDIREKGKDAQGNPISLDKRLFMQLLCFRKCENPQILIDLLQEKNIEGALYLDINDPTGIGLLSFNENPNYFVNELRDVINSSPFRKLTYTPEYTMFGRTYAIGHERDVEDWLLNKPRRTVTNSDFPWAIWYPLRREGKFAQLTEQDQKKILMEHGKLGHEFGNAGLAYDIRLASYGLDKNDNDFVIGLVGRELFALSATIQAMRATRQTSEFLQSLGPFFIGKAIWQNAII